MWSYLESGFSLWSWEFWSIISSTEQVPPWGEGDSLFYLYASQSLITGSHWGGEHNNLGEVASISLTQMPKKTVAVNSYQVQSSQGHGCTAGPWGGLELGTEHPQTVHPLGTTRILASILSHPNPYINLTALLLPILSPAVHFLHCSWTYHLKLKQHHSLAKDFQCFPQDS